MAETHSSRSRRARATPRGDNSANLPSHRLDQYKILADLIQFEHTRWTDNYKIFLTLATVIVAGEGALVGSTRWPTTELRVFLVCLIALAVVVSWAGKEFVVRPERSVNFWYFMLRHIESLAPGEFFPIFTQGNEVLRGGSPTAGASGPSRPLETFGRTAARRGRLTQLAVGICYAFMAIQAALFVWNGVTWWKDIRARDLTPAAASTDAADHHTEARRVSPRSSR